MPMHQRAFESEEKGLFPQHRTEAIVSGQTIYLAVTTEGLPPQPGAEAQVWAGCS